MANVFAYGSLMYPEVWERVVRGKYRSSRGTIHGFRRLGVRDEEYPALVIDKTAAPIEGRVYFDVTADDVALLDAFETTQYARVSVAVTIDQKPIVADAYLFLDIEKVTDRDWDPALFEREGLPKFLATYVARYART